MITALIALAGTIVHLSNVVADNTGVNREDLATSFDTTAEAIPAEVNNREFLQLSLRQVATGIRNSGAGNEYEQLISRLLH